MIAIATHTIQPISVDYGRYAPVILFDHVVSCVFAAKTAGLLLNGIN